MSTGGHPSYARDTEGEKNERERESIVDCRERNQDKIRKGKIENSYFILMRKFKIYYSLSSFKKPNICFLDMYKICYIL